MSTVLFAVCVSALTPSGHHAFRQSVSLLPIGEQLAHVDISEVDSYEFVNYAIDHDVGLRTPRSDRGSHRRWDVRTPICENSGIIQSMPNKGRTPGDSAYEGLFIKIKNKSCYVGKQNRLGRDELITATNDYVEWYNNTKGLLTCCLTSTAKPFCWMELTTKPQMINPS